MNITADLHLHSRYARACSKYISIPNLEKYARLKGIDLLATGDFQHPKWLPELKKELTDNGEGIMLSKTGYPFLLQTEISLMYKHDGKGRRVHHIVFVPNFEVADQVQEHLKTKGRIDYDGRPIFKTPSPEFVENLKGISKEIEIIPAHIWTPWFAIFGSKSGFDSLKDCFQDQTKHIHAIETGLSSDPAMNWRVSQLDGLSIVSFSDAHSHWPWRIGREATVFDMKKLSYTELIKAIHENKIVETLEFYPEEGKYHYDGHRACGVCLTPKESKAINYICPSCKSGLTVGVASRVEELADRKEGYRPKNAKPYRSLIPLAEIISHVLGSGVTTKKVQAEYFKLVKEFGTELKVLYASAEKLSKHVNPKLANAIAQVRTVNWKPGYDGVYGVPLFDKSIK